MFSTKYLDFMVPSSKQKDFSSELRNLKITDLLQKNFTVFQEFFANFMEEIWFMKMKRRIYSR